MKGPVEKRLLLHLLDYCCLQKVVFNQLIMKLSLKHGGRLVNVMLVLVKSITYLLFNEQGLSMVAFLSFLESTKHNDSQIYMEELDFFLSKDRAF